MQSNEVSNDVSNDPSRGICPLWSSGGSVQAKTPSKREKEGLAWPGLSPTQGAAATTMADPKGSSAIEFLPVPCEHFQINFFKLR